jgi:hypothetical protein
MQIRVETTAHAIIHPDMYQEGLMRVIKTLDGIMPVMYLYELAF